MLSRAICVRPTIPICPKKIDKLSDTDTLTFGIGFRHKVWRNGSKRQILVGNRNDGIDHIARENTHIVYRATRPLPSACFFLVFNRQPPPIGPSAPVMATPPERRLPQAQTFLYSAPLHPRTGQDLLNGGSHS